MNQHNSSKDGDVSEYGGQCPCGTQIIKKDGGDWHCPRCHPDILERAKALLEKTIDPYLEGEPREIPHPTLFSFFQREDEIFRELIAEVERLRSENARLSTPNAVDDWGDPLVLSVSGGTYKEDGITAKDARIKELEAYIERLEAAFLKLRKQVALDSCHLLDAKIREEYGNREARKALEIIKEGGKDER